MHLFKRANTIWEVHSMQTISNQHKMLYMILKYYLHGVLQTHRNLCSYKSACPSVSSYEMKTNVLNHVKRCLTQDHNGGCLFSCLCNVFLVMKNSKKEGCFMSKDREGKQAATALVHVIESCVEIGKHGSSNSEFKIECISKSDLDLHPIYERRRQIMNRHHVECHLDEKCSVHDKHLMFYPWMYPLYDCKCLKALLFRVLLFIVFLGAVGLFVVQCSDEYDWLKF